MLVRLVTAVKDHLRKRSGSTTVVPVARASATCVLATGCQCQRGAGVAAPSGCVRPAIVREDRLKPTVRVRHRHPIGDLFNFLSLIKVTEPLKHTYTFYSSFSVVSSLIFLSFVFCGGEGVDSVDQGLAAFYTQRLPKE